MTISAHNIYPLNHAVSWSFSRSDCNGKEKDWESGFHYYGARYYWGELLTGWLSVDPMMDKYPDISSYAYCAWNPVKLVDPDGCMIDDYFSYEGKYLGSDDADTKRVRIMSANHWNRLEKNEKGQIGHLDGDAISYAFSETSELMTEKAQLSVYQHFNLTGYTAEAAPSNETTSNYPGMITSIGCEGKDRAIVKHLYIRLENNRNPNKDGDALCDNASEIVSCFVHENDHIQRALKMGYKKWFKMNQSPEGKRDIEGSAIAAQRSHSSWKGCRDSFKKGIERYEKTH